MKRWMVLVSAMFLTSMNLFGATSEQEIWDKWQSSPEFKEYQRLGWEKSEAAKKLKEDTIRAITTEVLKPYIASFDVKYQAMMEKKIQEMPLGLQTLLANIDTKIMEKINKNHSPTEINMLNTFIYQYVKSIKDDWWACVSNLDKITSKFPELAGTDVDKFLREIWNNYDNAATASANADKAEKLNKELDIIIDKMKKM